VTVTFPADVTIWIQDLVHSGRAVYGLLHHSGDPRLPGLWRVDVEEGQFDVLRFTSGQLECHLPLNEFDIGTEGLSAAFFCPPGCDPAPCLSGEVRDGGAVVMPYRGLVQGEWSPSIYRDATGSVEGWRYFMEELEQTPGFAPGSFVLKRTPKRVRGRS
jgi:hypothetical protein